MRSLLTAFFMFILKVKGKKKIPDYIQLRDDNYVLVAYFSYRQERPFKNLEKYGLEGKDDEFRIFVEQMPYGKLMKLEL